MKLDFSILECMVSINTNQEIKYMELELIITLKDDEWDEDEDLDEDEELDEDDEEDLLDDDEEWDEEDEEEDSQ
jgi:hypothetical protein